MLENNSVIEIQYRRSPFWKLKTTISFFLAELEKILKEKSDLFDLRKLQMKNGYNLNTHCIPKHFLYCIILCMSKELKRGNIWNSFSSNRFNMAFTSFFFNPLHCSYIIVQLVQYWIRGSTFLIVIYPYQYSISNVSFFGTNCNSHSGSRRPNCALRVVISRLIN